jgi:corrinoid protein of di/trimethylamine methyltransferase
MTELLVQALVEMKEAEALQKARQFLDAGVAPLKILESCSRAMEIVGQRFEKGVYFLPHLMMAGEMLKQISAMIKPLVQEQKSEAKGGKVLIGTVEGDIHDIGKTVVAALLSANGYEVHDLGVEVHSGRFLEAAAAQKADVIGLSALLSTTMLYQRDVLELLRGKGLKEKFFVAVGGAPVTQAWAAQIGADGYARGAYEAVQMLEANRRRWAK